MTVPPAPAPAPRATVTLFVLCAAQFVLQLDFSVVNVALPTIRTGLGFSASALQWIVTGYALTFGSLLLLGGRAGDLLGQRRVLLTGLAVFGAASLGCGFAPAPGWLIAARFVQGAAGALIAPAALSTLTLRFADGPARIRALGIWQAATAAGGTAGIVLGGLLVQLVGWRSIFVINVPVIIALLVLVPRVVPPRAGTDKGTLRVGPSLLVTAAIASVILGLSSLETAGPTSPSTFVPVLVGLALAATFVVLQARSRNPLVPRPVLASRMRRGALLTMVITGAVLAGYVYFVSLFLQTVLRFDPLGTGVALLPATVLIVLLSSLVARRFIARVGLQPTALTGTALLIAGQTVFSLLSPEATYLANILPGLVLTALGIGLLLPALSIAATADIPASVQGEGASLLTTAQQIGAALGVATLASLAATRTSAGASVADGYASAFLVSACAMVVALVVVAISFRRTVPGASGTSGAPTHASGVR
ncbi:MFS transporter [Curtobacterium flaccumfaciens]|uniref:MFS transporter n=1 Tax=Curtobacterium flaccumfaciens TaxID=2035 RepID=UPI003EBA9C09